MRSLPGARLGLESIAQRDDGPWRAYGREERVRHEIETLEVAITAHPVEVLRERLEREGRMPAVVPAAEIGKGGGEVGILGMIAAARRVRTKRDEPMLFLTLDEPSGLVECTLFPAVYARFGDRIRRGAVLLARGRVEARYGAPTLTVDRIDVVGDLSGNGGA